MRLSQTNRSMLPLPLALFLCFPAQGQEALVTPADAISGILFDCTPNTQERSTLALAQLGPKKLPELFDVLADGRFAIRVGDHGNSRRALSAPQRTALIDAIGRQPRNVWSVFFTALLERDPVASSGERMAAMEVLANIGTTADLALFTRFGEPEEGRKRPSKAMRTAFARSLRRFVLREPRSLDLLAGVFEEAHRALFLPLLEALRADVTFANLEALSGLLGIEPRIDTLVLSEMGRMGAILPHPHDSEVRASVRWYLRHEEPQIVVEAALAAGALEDREAVTDLISLLDHDDRNVRRKSFDALTSITGRSIAPDVERWSEWHEHELAWWTEQSKADFALLRTGRPAEISRLVLDLSKKRYFRHELTAPLSAALEHDQPDIVVLTCAALGHLESPTSVSALVDCLDHRSDDVRRAAWNALRRLTGYDLGPEAAEWKPVVRQMQERRGGSE